MNERTRFIFTLLLLSTPLKAGGSKVIHWQLCATCHGAEGHGNKAIHAPAIAGLPDWYVERQLNKFRDGIRGAHPDDIEGHLMRPMARAIPKEQIPIISRYISLLPPKNPKATINGDPQKGKTLYLTCMACHGPNSEGNPTLKAPTQKVVDDWYLYTQLRKFKAGIRGTHPKDIEGMTMKPIMALLQDEEAMRDVISYIRTLSSSEDNE